MLIGIILLEWWVKLEAREHEQMDFVANSVIATALGSMKTPLCRRSDCIIR